MHLKYKTKNQKSYVYLLLTLVKLNLDFCESFVAFVVMYYFNIFILSLIIMKLFLSCTKLFVRKCQVSKRKTDCRLVGVRVPAKG